MTICQHCGCEAEPAKKGKPRSVPQHRRYFALLRAAYNHWPEKHEFKPQSQEHLRKWLQAKAGHRVVDTIETDGMSPAQSVAVISARMRAAGPFAFVSAVGSKLHIITSESIDFDTLPHLAACALFDDVSDVIETETGIRCDNMIRHTPRTSKGARVPDMQAGIP
jgi:hypothetical protein